MKTTNAATNFACAAALSQKLGAGASCPRERQLHLGSRGPAALSAERSADEQPHQDHWRERDGQLERQRPERHHRQERHLLRRDSLSSTGGLPRISFNRGERPIGKSKIYFGVNTEYVTQIYKTVQEGKTIDDRGLTRLDVNPVVRIPFTKWPFLTVNSTMSWRDTYWTESLNSQGMQVPRAASIAGSSTSRPGSRGPSSTGSSTSRTAPTPRSSSTSSSRPSSSRE